MHNVVRLCRFLEVHYCVGICGLYVGSCCIAIYKQTASKARLQTVQLGVVCRAMWSKPFTCLFFVATVLWSAPFTRYFVCCINEYALSERIGDFAYYIIHSVVYF